MITKEEAAVIKKVLDYDHSTKANTASIHHESYSTNQKTEGCDGQVVSYYNQLRKNKNETASNQKRSRKNQSTNEKADAINNTADHNQSPKADASASEVTYYNQLEQNVVHNLIDKKNTTIQEMSYQTEAVEFKKVSDQCGFTELMTLMEEKNNAWRDTKIKIAITGESGSGKSSLINALRGLKDDDYGAAETDCVEKTTEPLNYPHPDNKNLELWDLPGVGTPNFSQETYLEDVMFAQYDFILLVSSSRYTNIDTWLAKQITRQYPDSNLIFVRTKIDGDLDSKQKGRRTPMTDNEINELFCKIKQNCYDNLIKVGIRRPHVFMVNSHDQTKYDFGKLTDMLLAKVTGLKKDALVMTIQCFTKDIVAAKYDLCIKRMVAITKQSSVAAVKSNRENGERLEIEILKREVLIYRQQFGIDTQSVEIVAQRFGLDCEQVYTQLNSKTHAISRTFDEFYRKHDNVVTSQWHSLPLLGQWMKLKNYQTQCYFVLKLVLKECVNENKILQEKIAIWSLIPN
ncbi:T-cell-specific guanine nucleotide triphosphate-binding protein 2-like isoform X2 [Dreissena polymorpha]|nr:T-cell-specific guanine nucleotide triphosphate-binding protein 2-like isoform X2 [Dreissena polymorpha]XP_052244015.1 T-cell-specific guanine nucleotide triphosphate-binding protein 2-like isoform X2 [Dreissena polymorpha]